MIALLLLAALIQVPSPRPHRDIGNARPSVRPRAQTAVQLPSGQDQLLPFAYAPFRPGQMPGGLVPSLAEIEEDLGILEPLTGFVRTYGACGPVGAISALAEDYGIRVFQGVSLSADMASNQQEMDCFAAMAAQQPNISAGVIGNEVLLREELSEEALAGFMAQAKQLSSIPVSTGEIWGIWCNFQAGQCSGLETLAVQADYVLAHILPYWEAVPIEHAAAHVVAVYSTLRAAYPGKRVIVGETGWPSCGPSNGEAVPSLGNQRRFAEEVRAWSIRRPVPLFYLEAFDQEWKAMTGEGLVGACWGLHFSDRAAKHSGLITPLPVSSPLVAGPTVTIDHRLASPTLTKPNCGVPVFGRAYAPPGWKVKLEVFTDQWYLQDRWYVGGLAPIVDESWGVPEVFLAGTGQFNDHSIRATLVDGSGTEHAQAQIDGIVRTNSCIP